MQYPERYLSDGQESNAGGAHADPQPQQREQDAVRKEAGQPGSAGNAAGMDRKAEPGAEERLHGRSDDHSDEQRRETP